MNLNKKNREDLKKKYRGDLASYMFKMPQPRMTVREKYILGYCKNVMLFACDSLKRGDAQTAFLDLKGEARGLDNEIQVNRLIWMMAHVEF